MATSPSAPPPHSKPLLLPFLRYALLVGILNLVIAVCIRLVVPWAGSFESDLIYSEWIGMSIFCLHFCMSLLPLPGSEGLRDIQCIVISAPLGLAFGSWLAATLVGDPASPTMILNAPRFELVATVIGSAAMVYFLWSRQRLQQEEHARARAQQLAAETQLRLLHSQLEPHMLFNTLANLRILVDIDPPRAQTMIDQLIAYLRSTLAASRIEWTTVAAEFEQLTAYLELMRVRMGDRLIYRLEASEAARQQHVPPMLMQPLVENAIKHGLEPAIDGGEIRVKAEVIGRVLHLTVEDTGLGSAAAPTEGYGLTHVRERLAVLYGPEAKMSTASTAPHGFRVMLEAPLQAERA